MAKLEPGTVVAGCRIESVVGRGGMGLVYRATQLSLDRTVALKLVAPELAINPGFRERFKRESRLAALIEHPNVVPVYEWVEAGDQLYLIMRYIEGTDLRALLRSEGALESQRAAAIVGQVAAALAAAHRRGLIHRDVKPANILIDPSGGEEHAYLTDFGIARDISSTEALTRTGTVVGTLDYIAPERLQDTPADGRSDVYALGCVLFETLTGRVPYPVDNDLAKMYAHMNTPVPSPRDVRPDVPEEMARLTMRAMAKDPAQRFGTADELATALRPQVTPLPPPAEPAAPSEVDAPTELAAPATEIAPADTPPPHAPTELAPRTPPAPAPTGTGPTAPLPPDDTATELAAAPAGGPPAPPPPTRRRRTGLIAGAAAAVLAAGALAVVLLSGGSGDSGGDGQQRSSGQRSSAAGLNPQPLPPVDVGSGADGVAVGAGAVWVANKKQGTVTRIDARSRRIEGTTSVGANPDSVAIGGGLVWVTNTDDDSVSLIDPRTAEVTRTIPVGDAPEGIVATGAGVYVENSGDGTVSRVDADGGTSASASVGTEPIQLDVAENGVWVTVTGDGTVNRVDVGATRSEGSVRVGGSPRGIAVADGLLWVSATEADQIVVIDPGTERLVDRIEVPANPREVRAGEGAVWVSCADAGSVVAIDTSKRRVVAETEVSGSPYGLGVGEGRVWAAGLDNGLLTPIDVEG